MPVKDENKLPDLEKRLKKMDGKSVQIGFFGQDHVNMIANVHEFGAIIKPVRAKALAIPTKTGVILKKEVTIPERSFLRTSFDDKKVIRKIIDEAKNVYDEKINPTKILDRIGLLMTAEIQKKIKSNIQPANAPITTEMKGGKTKTLIDTGRMHQSVTHKVK